MAWLRLQRLAIHGKLSTEQQEGKTVVVRYSWSKKLISCDYFAADNIIHLCKRCWHMDWMTVRTSIIFALVLGFCLAMTSVVSAALMAPDRTSIHQAAQASVFGATASDFCGDIAGQRGHEHSCPFCHAVPSLPQLTAPDMCLAFRPHELWRPGEALRRAAQARNINHSTRAPPRIA